MRNALAIFIACGVTATTAAAPTPQQIESQRQFLAACGAVVDSEAALRRLPGPQRREKVACVLRELARQLNEDLPQRDPILTSEKIEADGLRLTYPYTLHRDAATITPQQHAALTERSERAVRAQVCGGLRFPLWVALGASVASVVRDRNGTLLAESIVTRC